MARLEGKTAIVTGGAISLGAEFSRALAAEGARVVIADLKDGAPVVAEIEAAGGAALSVTADVSEEATVRGLVNKAVEQFGAIDILVNNAAVFSTLDFQPVTEIETELWDRVMAVNVRGPYLLAKHVVPHMISAGGGRIVNISSGVAYKGMASMSHYATSKAALLGLTRSLSRELGEYGIGVNSLAPGLIASGSLDDRQEQVSRIRDRVVASRAFKREGVPADLVGALIFLASDESGFITGQSIVIDGGSINI